MKTASVLNLVAWAVAWPALGCGGSVQTVEGGDAGGALGSCGDNCSPAQLAAACSATCDRIAAAGCLGVDAGDCTTSCEMLPTVAPSCTAAADAYLRCAESMEPACTGNAGTNDVFPGCESTQQALSDCVSNVSVVTPTGPSSGGSSGGVCAVPADVCPDIPRLSAAGPSACSGGGGGTPGGPVTSMTSCQDGAGNTWSASCTGSTCTCTYNGGAPCTCTVTTAPGMCGSCCPGTD